MITLCMDTSSKFLVLALIEDHQLIGKRCLLPGSVSRK